MSFKIGLSQGAIESYETGSFITGKDAGTLNTGIKIFGDLHEKNKEAYDEIYETEQKIKDEAEKRKTQGIWRTVGGAVLIATGVACIVLTGGAAIPIVADVAVAVGSGTAVFGAADAIEGTQDIYYGSTGDIDSTAVNGIKDGLFQGNEDAYYLTENAFAFAASAMIPIGHASTAGNLTFKSTATIVAKEGISMGAGAGAQKITTDVTGNDTAGMVAGMVASGVTAKGLNGIEAEANKLAKAPKGLDGVTEGTGNVAEDVGKAGKGLEGAAKGAESAAEDAGKVVESGTDSWNMVEGGGTINGREYSQHAMERMAPDTPQVRAELSRRAEKSATQRGLKVGTQEYYEYCKKYVDPRNIPPSVIEDAISSTKGIPGNRPDTFIHETADVKIVINSAGKVITVIPK